MSSIQSPGIAGCAGTDPILLAALVEYSQLKTEQISRMAGRDHFLYAMLIATGAVSAVVLEDRSHWIALVGIPFISFVISSLYSANDGRVTEIGNYLRRELGPRLAEHIHCNASLVFGWEEHRLADSTREARKRSERHFLRAAFLVPSVAAGLVCAYLAPFSLPIKLAAILPFLAPLWPVERTVSTAVEEDRTDRLKLSAP